MDDLGKLWLLAGHGFPRLSMHTMYYYHTTVGLCSEAMILLQFSVVLLKCTIQ